MASSPAHRVGQIIGYALELSMEPLLRQVASEHSLYLDTIGARPTRNGRKLLNWVDDAGNGHNLDFVLERGGTPTRSGTPVGFIEVAWRRYTKHSVNKAGEIANALVPLRQTHSRTRPFTGAVVAGVWTEGGIQHLRSQGITVLYVPLSNIVATFSEFGIDVDFSESTSTSYLAQQVDAWEALTPAEQKNLSISLMRSSAEGYAEFRETLDVHLRRQVSRVLVLFMHGHTLTYGSAAEAIRDLSAGMPTPDWDTPLLRIEVQVRYSNGDRIDAEFDSLSDAILFLESQA